MLLCGQIDLNRCCLHECNRISQENRDGGRGIVLLNIGICSCVEKVLQHLLYILIFSACQTSL